MHSLQGNRTQLRPGFPIRTPSDQRFVDNSPRLNAVSHVLHRLSMPRHPPCALEQQTHTRKTQHTNKTHTNKKTRCSRPLYSSHTPHPPPTNQHKTVSKQMTGHKKGSTTPTPQTVQAPCVAPDTQQCTNEYSVQLSTVHASVSTPPSILSRGGRVSTWYFKTKTLAAPRSCTQPTHPQLRAQIKAP